MFHIFDNISIGLNPDMSKDLRHGVAWFRDHTGEMYKHSFLVDKPQSIEDPSWSVLYLLFKQIAKMGFTPVNLEFINDRRHVVYEYGRVRPIFFQPGIKHNTLH